MKSYKVLVAYLQISMADPAMPSETHVAERQDASAPSSLLE